MTKVRKTAERDRRLGRYRVHWFIPKRESTAGDLGAILGDLLGVYGTNQTIRVTATGYEVISYHPDVDLEPVVLARVVRPFPARAWSPWPRREGTVDSVRVRLSVSAL